MKPVTIDVTIRFPIDPSSVLYELLRRHSKLGLRIMSAKAGERKRYKALYDEADAALKAALKAEFGIENPIENLSWDSEAYLSADEHADILLPEG